MFQIHVVFLLIAETVGVFALDFITTLGDTPVVRLTMAVAEETLTTLNQRSSVNSHVGLVVSSLIYILFKLLYQLSDNCFL